MIQPKENILAQLRREVLLLQGLKTAAMPQRDSFGLGSINAAFPGGCFPAAGLHEFFCYSREEQAASSAFVAGLLSTLMKGGAPVLWISKAPVVFPPALKSFGIPPEGVIFLYLKQEREIAWAVEEALQCNALAGVVGELPGLSFTGSRRLQLCIEKSGVPCFVIRPHPKKGATASLTRWHIRPLHSSGEEDMPGVGHPRWKIELLRVRNGRPGSWELQWSSGGFHHLPSLTVVHRQWHQQTG